VRHLTRRSRLPVSLWITGFVVEPCVTSGRSRRSTGSPSWRGVKLGGYRAAGANAHRTLDRRVARPRAERANKKAADYGREIAKLQADGVTSLWTMASGTQRATRQDAARQWRVASRTGEPSAASLALGG
jgi:hypothetical protein